MHQGQRRSETELRSCAGEHLAPAFWSRGQIDPERQANLRVDLFHPLRGEWASVQVAYVEPFARTLIEQGAGFRGHDPKVEAPEHTPQGGRVQARTQRLELEHCQRAIGRD